MPETAYHHTEILRFNDKEITLNTGGWNTKTTREHMNEFLPWGQVCTVSGQLMFGYNGLFEEFDEELTIPANDWEFMNKHLPYGRVDCHMHWFYDGIELKWNEIMDKWGGLPKNVETLRLYALYGKKHSCRFTGKLTIGCVGC